MSTRRKYCLPGTAYYSIVYMNEKILVGYINTVLTVGKKEIETSSFIVRKCENFDKSSEFCS